MPAAAAAAAAHPLVMRGLLATYDDDDAPPRLKGAAACEALGAALSAAGIACGRGGRGLHSTGGLAEAPRAK